MSSNIERPVNYKTIKKLNISGNFISRQIIKELPSWISECKKLRILICDKNEISELKNLPIL